MLTLSIICIIVLFMYLWEAHRSRVRLQMFREEHEKRKETYSELQKVKNKLDSITKRPRLSNGKFTKK